MLYQSTEIFLHLSRMESSLATLLPSGLSYRPALLCIEHIVKMSIYEILRHVCNRFILRPSINTFTMYARNVNAHRALCQSSLGLCWFLTSFVSPKISPNAPRLFHLYFPERGGTNKALSFQLSI